jgi:hypothetical protein
MNEKTSDKRWSEGGGGRTSNKKSTDGEKGKAKQVRGLATDTTQKRVGEWAREREGYSEREGGSRGAMTAPLRVYWPDACERRLIKKKRDSRAPSPEKRQNKERKKERGRNRTEQKQTMNTMTRKPRRV